MQIDKYITICLLGSFKYLGRKLFTHLIQGDVVAHYVTDLKYSEKSSSEYW
jgi:hypothetical protein